MSEINWKEDAVCYAMDMQWCDHENSQLLSQHNTLLPYVGTIDIKDFQLNEITTGDFIPVSELDTEKKYNEVVEVFGLFGFKRFNNASYADTIKAKTDSSCLKVNPSGELICNWHKGDCQLTYHQIIAIGKLKRMMLEREKSAPKTTADLAADNTDQVKNPKHYQLIEGVESIEIIARSMTKEQWKGFCLGNMLKYRIRAGKKDALQQDIGKANFYGELYEMHKEKCYD